MSARAGRSMVAALVVAALAACGLPVESGVRSAGPVAPEAVERGGIQVLPPGPRADAGAREIVLGFLGAQTSADADHALAREFLAPGLREEWDTDGGVRVYDPATLGVESDPTDPTVVTVRSQVVATIDADGGYQLASGTDDDVYRLARDERGQLRLVDVPTGLRLTPAGAERSFRAREVYYLAPQEGVEPVERLVPDRVFLLAGDAPDALVRQLLDGPTSALRGAVETAFPAEVALRRPVTVAEGVVTVDLTGPLDAVAPPARRRLAAQLVWTVQAALPAPPAVRLLVDGRPYEVPGVGELQGRSDWLSFDPDGPGSRSAALYVEDGRLRRLGGGPPRSDATEGLLRVDAAVASPRTGRLALLTRGGPLGGPDVVRTGPPAGPFDAVLEGPPVRSMSWGSGVRGLWVVTADPGGRDPRVLLVPAEPGSPPVEVTYARPGRAGPLQVVRVSRDGTRVAAVFGEGTERRVHVGRVERSQAGLRLAGLRSVAPTLTDVADVAWESGTSLVVLTPLGTPNRLPVRVAVDGSQVEPVRTLGLDGEPETVAAAPDQPLVVGAVLDGRPVLLVESGGLFRLQPGTGRAPAYEG